MSLIRRMSGWKRTVFINLFACVGIAISPFGLPEDTPFSVWAACAVATLVVMNLVVWRYSRRSQDSSERERPTSRGTLVIFGGALILIIDLIWSIWNNQP